MSDPRVGVVVITRNRPSVVQTLERLIALPEKPAVVMVDNNSSDETPDLVRSRFPTIEVFRLTHNQGAAARNVGVAALDRPYLALCDDDVWWDAGSLRRGADLMDAHDRLAVIAATVLVGEREAVDPTCLEMAASPLPPAPDLPGRPILGFLAGASLVRRRAFRATFLPGW